MRKLLNLILAAVVVALVYVCTDSLMGPIRFQEERKARETMIIKKLIDIRTAQLEYRTQTHQYTDNLDSLIYFVNTAKLPMIKKEGELNDEQLEAGLTEQKALEMIEKAKKTGKWKEVEEAGLTNFSRDTVWINLKDTIFSPDFCADSMRYVPFGNGAQFEMAVSCDTTKSGDAMFLFEAKTPYTAYLSDLNVQELKNLIDEQVKMERYPGLKVGDVEKSNNNAGNWE